jgi:outer membrane receptor for Fe3+-dicitrate
MVGKRRVYRPYSKDKIKFTVYNIITARMGAFGTESPLLQISALSYAEQVANAWDEYGNLAAKIYRALQAKLNVTGVKAAGLRALVGAAIKFIRAAKYGRLYTRDEVREHLEGVARRVGLDDNIAAQAIDMLLTQIPTANPATA